MVRQKRETIMLRAIRFVSTNLTPANIYFPFPPNDFELLLHGTGKPPDCTP